MSNDLGLGLEINEKSDFFFGGDKNVPKLIVVMVVHVCEYTKIIE